jgi:hypothetical protein
MEHPAIRKQYVYSFIYAETLAEAEKYLTALLNQYVRERFVIPDHIHELPVKVISRPNGWSPPDGFYLPPTSKQYAIKYSSNDCIDILREGSIHEEISSLAIDTGSVRSFKPFMIQ